MVNKLIKRIALLILSKSYDKFTCCQSFKAHLDMIYSLTVSFGPKLKNITGSLFFAITTTW